MVCGLLCGLPRSVAGGWKTAQKARYAIAMTVICAVVSYFAVGLLVALAFVSAGAAQMTHSSLTLGARVLILPAATALWPYVLFRWLKASRHP